MDAKNHTQMWAAPEPGFPKLCGAEEAFEKAGVGRPGLGEKWGVNRT